MWMISWYVRPTQNCWQNYYIHQKLQNERFRQIKSIKIDKKQCMMERDLIVTKTEGKKRNATRFLYQHIIGALLQLCTHTRPRSYQDSELSCVQGCNTLDVELIFWCWLGRRFWLMGFNNWIRTLEVRATIYSCSAYHGKRIYGDNPYHPRMCVNQVGVSPLPLFMYSKSVICLAKKTLDCSAATHWNQVTLDKRENNGWSSYSSTWKCQHWVHGCWYIYESIEINYVHQICCYCGCV